jgi:hypothetical protein
MLFVILILSLCDDDYYLSCHVLIKSMSRILETVSRTLYPLTFTSATPYH